MSSTGRSPFADRRDSNARRALWLRALDWPRYRLGWRGRLVLAAAMLVVLAAGFWIVRDAPWEAEPAQTPFAGTDGVVGLFVLPEDGHDPILDELAAASRSITLQIYLLTDEEIFAALAAAADRGVQVRVLLEKDPFGGPGTEDETFERLARSGVDVRWSDPAFRFSHVKTFVIDERVAIVMNQNLTTSAFAQNREFFAITTQASVVAQAAAIFRADWDRTGGVFDGPLVISPTNSRDVTLDLIGDAEETLDLYAEVVRDGEVIAAIVDAEDRGVEVRVIVSADSEEDDHGRFERALIRQAGAEVRFARGLYIHAKMILADQSTLFIGSQNLTATSLDDNREIGILVTDAHAIARAAAIFAADFATAVPEDAAGGSDLAVPSSGLASRARAEVVVLAQRERGRDIDTTASAYVGDHFRRTTT